MNRRISRLAAAAMLLFCSALLSCTKVDYALGDDFVPDGEQMEVGVATISGISTYLTQSDSLPTSRLTYAYFGSAIDPVYGHTTTAVASQFMLNYFTSGDKMFGTAPVFDSLVFTFTLNSAYLGDTTKVQTFNVYELKDNLDADTTYYANFDINAIRNSTPIFSFDLTNVPSKEFNLRVTGDEVDEFARKLMDTTGGTYTSDSLFYARNKGICIVPADPDASACVYRASLSGFEMALYTRSFTDATAQTVQDTVTTYYSFSTNSVLFNNASVSSIKHDYTNTPVQGINDTLPTDKSVDVSYIQTLGGVAAYVRFTDDFVKELRAKIVAPYKSMVINRAVLKWNLLDPTIKDYDWAPLRLGAYSSYRKWTGIPDYNYAYENTGDVSLMFDGYVNRTHGYYPTDISIFLQKMISSPDKAPRTMTLGPSVDGRYDFKQVALKTGDGKPPVQVDVTYTLVK